LNYYAPTYDTTKTTNEINQDAVYLKRSITCLEEKYYSQFFEIGTQLWKDISEIINPSPKNETADVYPCDSPMVKFKVGKFFKKTVTEK